MTRYILKRLVFAIFALFILMSIVFFLMTALPNAPIVKVQSETDASYHAKLESIGWFNPPISRYFLYWEKFFDGSFGQVFNMEGTSLVTYFFQNMPNTLYVAFMAYILAIILGFLFGIIAAVYRGKWQDTFINVISVVFISVPSFIIGILLLKLAGAIRLPQSFVNFGDPDFNVGTFIGSSIMPVLALTFSLASTLTYYVRNELVEVLSQDYIKTAMSKGLTRKEIILKHGIRNSLIPALSILGPSFLFVVSGSVVIEMIFGIHGIANMLYIAVVQNQFYLIMFQSFFISSIYFLITLVLDVSYTFIDPRIKLAESSQTSLYELVKSASQRSIWTKKWIKAKGQEYKWVSSEDSLFFALKEINCVN
ncbi:MAG: ABC transporter permease, partial [Mycoplasma sp.]|nr:ABC transporter permease [Mycoplasma sp.]